MRYTQNTLKRIEAILGELQYEVRYEKGHFQSGYCIVEQKRVVVVNKFFDAEARINCLLDILGALQYDPGALSETSRAWLKRTDKSENNDAPQS
ncbi:MAG: hypothetical protein ACK4NS_01585 [Saprospiraceae bacterium]